MHFVAPGPGQKANTECHSVRAFAEVHRKTGMLEVSLVASLSMRICFHLT